MLGTVNFMNIRETLHEQHVLVVGFDGVRYDSLVEAETPVLDGLAANGALLPVQVHQKNYTVSGPVWATVATGVYMDRHKVVGNSVHPAELAQFKDFTALLREQRPELETMIAVTWFPLANETECGPIFSSGGWTNSVDPEIENNNESWIKADDEVAAYAASRLRDENLAASFVYFGEPDVNAHNHGVGPDYKQCIERCDARLGMLIDAINQRPNLLNEDWTILAVTDHGHKDAGGHGGDSPEERTAWMLASGPTVPANLSALDHADIAVCVLETFGVTPENLDGVSLGKR